MEAEATRRATEVVMESRFCWICTGLFGFALVMALPRAAAAAWPTDPLVNVPLSTYGGDQQFTAIVDDGAGGAIVTWQDYRSNWNNSDIYVQHVLASGSVDPAWPAGGRALCTAPHDQRAPTIVSDGAGGAIVAWSDGRNDGGSHINSDIYAQHVLASGMVDPAWPLSGTLLCNADGDQRYPQLVTDGEGGAIVTWLDRRGGWDNFDIYAQRILASGAVDPAWTTNGSLICGAANSQFYPEIISDGAGGAIITWYDRRTGNDDIYAQRVLASGVTDPAWPVNGTLVCDAAGFQTHVEIVPDGAGGAIVAWDDDRNGPPDIYAQHVLASGVVDPGWTVNGTLLCDAPNVQEFSEIVSDDMGGAIVTWSDTRSGSRDVYAQHVLASGVVDLGWTANGTMLSNAASDQYVPQIVSDAAGGAIVTWFDYRVNSTNSDIYAQHVLSSGVVDPAWTVNGTLLCSAAADQRYPQLVSDAAGGAIVTWHDFRTGSSDTYAQRVQVNGRLGDDLTSVPVPTPRAPALSLDGLRPNPTDRDLVVSFSLPSTEPATVELIDLSGRIVVRHNSDAKPGSHLVNLQDVRALAPGIYLVRLTQGDRTVTRKACVVH
jgi:Secretion system C-terminal sorting domain